MTDSSDYRLYLETNFKTVNSKLDSIDNRLKTLNGKVAEHEKIINQNIPHTIALCPQSRTIEELKQWQAEQDGVETAEESFIKRSEIAIALEATKKRDKRQLFFQVIAATITFSAVLVSIYFGSKSTETAKSAVVESKATNELLAPDSTQSSITIRGSVYIPILKVDSANIIHSNKLDEIYSKYKE